MKRKLFALLLAALLALGTAFCFAGCGGGNGSASTPSDPSAPSSPSSPSSPSDTDPDDKTKPETPAEPSTPEEPDEKQDETPQTPEEPEENPDDTPVDPPAEKFSLAENREKIIENVMPLINFYKRHKYGNSSKINKVYDIYLMKSENSQIIDTIGIIFSGTTPAQDIYFEYGTITLSTTQNLNYQYLSNNVSQTSNSISMDRKYHFIVTASTSGRYAATIEKIQRKVFENYDDALWLGWTGVSGPQYDDHQIVCYDGKQIKETWITITNDHNTLPFPSGAVDKYFVNDQYKRYDNYGTTITLPEDTLSALIEKELREAEQK